MEVDRTTTGSKRTPKSSTAARGSSTSSAAGPGRARKVKASGTKRAASNTSRADEDTAMPLASAADTAKETAEESFDRHQELRRAARPTFARPRRGLVSGVRTMLQSLPSRGALTATTAIVGSAVGAFAFRGLCGFALSLGGGRVRGSELRSQLEVPWKSH